MNGTAAAIDIGSNTIHMLVGCWYDGRIEPIDEAAELVGLAEDVYGGGAISPGRLSSAVDAVVAMARRARERGAAAVLLTATAAVRDASNADELAAAVRDRAGLEMQAISGEREAELTYRGATAGEDAASVQVCDVGGGSTEVIRAVGGRVTVQTSLAIGSSRLSRHITADPPTPDELAVVSAAAETALAGLQPWRPARLIVTGGTATALARVAGNTGRRYVMTVEALARVRVLLAARPAARVAADHDVEPKRARLLPAGAAIVAALCASTGVSEIVLTAAGLRDGMLIEYFEEGVERG